MNRRWIAAALLVLLVVGCGVQMDRSMKSEARDSAKQVASAGEGSIGGAAASSPVAAGDGIAMGGAPAAPAPKARALAAPDRYLIRTGEAAIEVADARTAATRVKELVRASNGYVSDSSESADELGVRTVSLTVRVPATGFEELGLRLEKLGKVLRNTSQSEDVTEEMVDTQSRLRNLRRTEERLLEHLSRSGRLSDTLQVERELTRVRGEIEQADGRVRYLSRRVSYSTLVVSLSEAPRSRGASPPASYSSGQVASDATRSLVEFGRQVWSYAIWLGVWAIVWVPTVGAVVWVVRRRRARRA